MWSKTNLKLTGINYIAIKTTVYVHYKAAINEYSALIKFDVILIVLSCYIAIVIIHYLVIAVEYQYFLH